jgi:hypothetical protein
LAFTQTLIGIPSLIGKIAMTTWHATAPLMDMWKATGKIATTVGAETAKITVQAGASVMMVLKKIGMALLGVGALLAGPVLTLGSLYVGFTFT